MATPSLSTSTVLGHSGDLTTSTLTNSMTSLNRGRKWMKLLCWAQLVLAVFALTFGSACTGINASHERTVCTFGTGIWVGLLSVCCAAVGFIAIQQSSRQRILLIVYFLLCSIAAIASVILLGVSSMWIDKATKLYNENNERNQMVSITLNVILLLAAVCQTICTFLSAVLLAHYYWGWCCRSNDFASPIAYVRAENVPETNSAIAAGHHLYARRTDPYYASTPRQQEMSANVTNGHKYFY